MATKKSKKPILTEVPDFNGNPTRVGDKVVYIAKTYCTANLAFGVVSGLSRVFGQDCVVIDKYGGLSKDKPTSLSFYKVSDGTSTIDPNLTKAICEATCG